MIPLDLFMQVLFGHTRFRFSLSITPPPPPIPVNFILHQRAKEETGLRSSEPHSMAVVTKVDNLLQANLSITREAEN